MPGAAVLPAFHDSHIHLGMMASDRLAPNLFSCTDIEQVSEVLRKFNNTHQNQEWIIGGHYDPQNQRGRELINVTFLDSIFGNRPALITSADGHTGWANSAALRAAEITADTPDPAGGKIVRDANGKLTGQLLEHAITPLLKRADTALRELLLTELDRVQQQILALGITHVTDFDTEHTRVLLTQLHLAEQLKLRVHKSVRANEMNIALAKGRETGDGDHTLSTASVKFFADGTLGARTAYLHEPYADNPSNHGMLTFNREELERDVITANEHGLAVSVHAIGNRANTLVLDIFEKTREIATRFNLRNRIEHAQLIKESDLKRYAELGVCVSMQPTHCTGDYPRSIEIINSADTLFYPWQSLLKTGATLALGSDSPLGLPDPFHGVHAAVTRTKQNGIPAGGREPHERLTRLQTLQAYTHGAAYAAGIENRSGYLSKNHLADFIAVNQDPFRVDAAELWQLRVLTTIVSGEIVYNSK
nr:amidohydrolase [Canibacter zhuwentaonis]